MNWMMGALTDMVTEFWKIHKGSGWVKVRFFGSISKGAFGIKFTVSRRGSPPNIAPDYIPD